MHTALITDLLQQVDDMILMIEEIPDDSLYMIRELLDQLRDGLVNELDE